MELLKEKESELRFFKQCRYIKDKDALGFTVHIYEFETTLSTLHSLDTGPYIHKWDTSYCHETAIEH